MYMYTYKDMGNSIERLSLSQKTSVFDEKV